VVHSDILMSGLGQVLALDQGLSAAQIGRMAERFSEFMRLRLICWVVDDSEIARGAMSLAPEAQPDLFSLNTD
jgi:hypothetical protein